MANKNSWAISPNKKIHQFAVGIDFGHGETSAAYTEIGWGNAAGTLELVKDIDLSSNGICAIPSLIAIDAENNYHIGENAFRNIKDEIHVCFKKRPVSLQGSDERLMINFMREVYKLIREKVGATFTDTNHLVYIATPSAWDKETQSLYGQMAKEAGLPIAGVTWESRAAYIHQQSSVDSGLPQFVDKGAIVFDMGSSTLDFTYISTEILHENKRPIDFGYDCGASKVEKLMYFQLKEKSDVIQDFEKFYPTATDKLLFTIRQFKEKYYRSLPHSIRGTIDPYDLVADEQLNPIRCNYNTGEIDDYLKQCGYVDEIRQCMVDFKNTHIKGKPIYAAFFTGGASRMDFLKDLVNEVWNVDYVYCDQNPSLTISRGLAEVARSDFRSGGVGHIKSELNNIMRGIDIYDTFSDKLGAKIQEEIKDSIAIPLVSFRDSVEDYCLADLEEAITNNIDSDIENIEDWAKECIEEAFETATNDIKEKVSQKITNYSKSDITMGKLSSEDIILPELDFDVISTQMHKLAEDFADKSSEWSDVFTGAAIGAIGAFMLGPIGWIGAGLYTAWKAFCGEEETEAQKREKAKYKELEAGDRLRVFNEFESNWADICEQIEETVSDALDDSSLRKSVKSQCDSILRKYAEECLRQTRLMLD